MTEISNNTYCSSAVSVAIGAFLDAFAITFPAHDDTNCMNLSGNIFTDSFVNKGLSPFV